MLRGKKMQWNSLADHLLPLDMAGKNELIQYLFQTNSLRSPLSR